MTVSISLVRIEESFLRFKFTGDNFSTSIYIDNPFSVPRDKWIELRNSIADCKYYCLDIPNGKELSCIENENDSSFLCFMRYPESVSGTELKISFKIDDTNKFFVLGIFDGLIEDHVHFWK